MTNQNHLTTQPQTFQTKLAKVNDTYLPMITGQLEGNGIHMTDYQKTCVMNAISEINNTLESAQSSIKNVDQQTLTQILLQVASLQLNAAATPREVYFQTRKKKVGNDWTVQLEMGIEGDGNDAILAKFGRGVQTVHKFWEVRENDKFIYPRMKGLTMTDPEWEPTGTGKVVRIVYPITKTTGEIEYLIAEREDVVRNLTAHINNNMMNETFGIAESRYKATPAQKNEIDAKKRELKAQMAGKTLEELLDDAAFEKYISPAWKEAQSRESMIVRKMRNNVTKKYPKNFENAFLAMTYEEATNEEVKQLRKDVTNIANSIEFEDIIEHEEITDVASDGPMQAFDGDDRTFDERVAEGDFIKDENPVQDKNKIGKATDPF